MKEIKVSRKKWQAAIILPVGVAIMMCVADALVFHKVIAANHSTWGQVMGGLLFAGFGLLLVVLSIRGLLATSTLMRADQSGITLYTGYNNATRPPMPQAITIPWSSVLSISKGQMVVGSVIRRQSPTTQLGGGFTVQRSTETQRQGDAVRVLMVPSVNLDHYSVPFAVVARTATRPEDITKEDREYFSNEGLKEFMLSECLIAGTLLGRPIDRVVDEMNVLLRQHKS